MKIEGYIFSRVQLAHCGAAYSPRSKAQLGAQHTRACPLCDRRASKHATQAIDQSRSATRYWLAMPHRAVSWRLLSLVSPRPPPRLSVSCSSSR
jgi:hypothetical protein